MGVLNSDANLKVMSTFREVPTMLLLLGQGHSYTSFLLRPWVRYAPVLRSFDNKGKGRRKKPNRSTIGFAKLIKFCLIEGAHNTSNKQDLEVVGSLVEPVSNFEAWTISQENVVGAFKKVVAREIG